MPAISQRQLLLGGVAAGGAATIFYLYRKNQKQKADAAKASETFSYGYAYGYGSGYAYGYGQTGYYQPEVYGYGLGYYGYGSGSYPVTTGAATTNAMWSQAAVTQLTSQGYDGQLVQAALGVYLTGGALTADQQSIVQAAIAVEGYPPQAGPGNYPPQMHTSPSGGQTGGGTGGSTVTGGHVVSVDNNRAVVAWTGAGPAKQWKATITGPGKINGHTGTTNIPQASYSGLEAGHNYQVFIQPLPTGTGGEIHFQTTR